MSRKKSGQRDLFSEASECSYPSQSVEVPAAFVPLEELATQAEPRLTGIARLAAEAAEIDLRNEVEYRELPCRTLINACNSARVPFMYAINPYRGCEFGCVYCYARYTHEYMELSDWLDFERKVFVKAGAREALVRDLRRLDLRGESISIGTATDPYQPAERRYGLTRSLLEVFAERRGLRLSITTKSDLVRRDLDLLTRIAEHNQVHVNITITTPHHTLSRLIELRAPRPDKRLAAVRALNEAGVPAGVFLMPLLPRINDRYEDLALLCRLAAEAGARFLAAQTLFLRSSSRRRYLPYIQERFPELVPVYERLYGRSGALALAEYTRAKRAELATLKMRYGLNGGSRLYATEAPEDQLRIDLL